MALNKDRVRNITFNTGRIVSKVRGAKKFAMTKLAKEMQARLRKTISKPFPPASTPGTPPHRRTGNLMRTTIVEFKRSKLVVRVPQYGIWLEGGTRSMDARPFVDPVVRKQRLSWERRARALMRQFVKAK